MQARGARASSQQTLTKTSATHDGVCLRHAGTPASLKAVPMTRIRAAGPASSGGWLCASWPPR